MLAAGLAVLAAAVTGCGVRPTEVVGAGDAPQPTGQPNPIAIYLVKDGRLVRTARPGLLSAPYLGLQQLSVRLVDSEVQQGLTTTIPAGVDLSAAYLDGSGVLTVHVNQADVNWPRITLGQVVCTANAAPNVKQVRLDYPVTVEIPPKASAASAPPRWELEGKLKQAGLRYDCGQFADLMAR
ncbi:GerMN domain-containing protein [Actinomadura gamaensis]|uniref:GerMN domain-containing protein n=1 Tax=Actinomadura gamaensis TaxID=1763541 RepID=A0ABV9TRZ3_9ACTN